jgi:hypothetical protein
MAAEALWDLGKLIEAPSSGCISYLSSEEPGEEAESHEADSDLVEQEPINLS